MYAFGSNTLILTLSPTLNFEFLPLRRYQGEKPADPDVVETLPRFPESLLRVASGVWEAGCHESDPDFGRRIDVG
ncbi:hypothetical protein NECAME_00344 [Necator americanus]|uniref:Uncharacterized protein n=1 Tax=Necator americanus TaxID=51031 RepID=W2TCP9_NECAM|nr:hypothetical protein NECAME_00344 [Necator americanus]ETN78971.1 hypothetical protein NECAME_00344 [Necator americanus]